MRGLTALTLACVATVAPAQSPPLAPPPPRLLVVISFDQFSADLFDEYRPHFTAGLDRLAGGTVFRNGYQSHATTETCPGHSTILTGDRPARTGIVSNAWGDRTAARADKTIYCAEDESVPGSTSDNYTVSAKHLRVPTLGDLMKARWPGTRNVAVAGKDRSAVMMSGHKVDQRWYWDRTGFVTDLSAAPVPASVAAANAAIAREIATAQPALVPPPFCAAKAQQFTIEGRPPVGAGAFAREAGKSSAFRASPEADAAALALAASLVREMNLGKAAGGPDILSIGLAATDYVGHTYGTGGQEMCLNLLSLDRDLGDFLAYLDSREIDYSVALTADHGGLDIPERMRTRGVADAARIDPALTPKLIGEQVTRQTGIAGPILVDEGVIGDLYLDSKISGANRRRALNAVLAAYRAHPQVAAAFSKDELARTPSPSGNPSTWTLIQRARASFDPDRSGDLYVMLKQNITPIGHITGSVATHGSPWDYDRRVPILFWRSGMAASDRGEAIETVDIMPTLGAQLGLVVDPAGIDGKCLTGIQGIACPPR
ncbi:MAG: alkaline phosphatase family protein [Sphingomicrobium sp.]